MTETQRAEMALTFARLHDWGQTAYLERERSGRRWRISGLSVTWTDRDGETYMATVSVDASIPRLKRFGRY